VKVPRDERGRMRVRDVLSRELTVTYPDESVQAALDKIYEKGVGRLPVVDRKDPTRLLGIITQSDIVKAYEMATRRVLE